MPGLASLGDRPQYLPPLSQPIFTPPCFRPGYKLPENVVAIPDLLEAAQDADIFIFVIPHQFLPRLCAQLKV